MNTNPIRILHCVVNMNRGGAETLIMNIYRNINRDKVQFDFLTSNEGVFDEEIRRLGGKVYKIPYITKVGPIKYAHNIYNFLCEHSDYKIVHSHMDKMSGLVMREAKKAGIPVRIAHSYSSKSEGGVINKLIKSYYKYYIKNANYQFACSENAAEFLFNKPCDTILKNGIETKEFSFNDEIRRVYRELNNLKNNFVIGHIGRFNEPKNHDFLIDVFQSIRALDKTAKLVLVGDEKLKNKIYEKVRNLSLTENTLFLGQRADVANIMQMMDVFVFPSLYEGFPVSLVEAQTSGLKCVVSDTITKDVDIYDDVDFMSLKESPKLPTKSKYINLKK